MKAGLWFRLGLFVIVSPDRSYPGRLQADNPLSPLCRFAEPPLTTIAKVIKNAAEHSGLRVIALAPTYVAADELRTSIGVPSQVVAKFRAASRRQQADDAFRLDARTVILLDEAGMLDMSAVLVAAARAGSKVIAFGDRRQLASVA